jgi:hypothetical protein
MVELRVTSTWNMCWKYDHLLLINFLRMASSCQNILELVPNMKCFRMFYCILISAICWLKYGINKILFDYDWNTDTSVILKYMNVLLPVVEDETSLLRLQNALPYLIMSHMNLVHTFITYLFTIPCNHLIHLICLKILNSHLKFQILYRPVLTVLCISAINRIMSMPMYKECSLFCLQLNILCFSYTLTLLHRHQFIFLISSLSFRRVVNVVQFLLGNYPKETVLHQFIYFP